MSQKIVQSQLSSRLLKAASKLGLHYFLWNIKSTMALKDLIQSNYVTVLYSVASSLSFSPLNEIMKHSNTALWTIPKFDLGDFYHLV